MLFDVLCSGALHVSDKINLILWYISYKTNFSGNESGAGSMVMVAAHTNDDDDDIDVCLLARSLKIAMTLVLK